MADDDLARAQAAVVKALIDGASPPLGIDPKGFAATSGVLRRKRRTSEAAPAQAPLARDRARWLFGRLWRRLRNTM